MIVFGTDCNFFIVLPIQLKTCRFKFLFYMSKCARPKNRVRFRGFVRPNASERARSTSGAQFVQVCVSLVISLFFV